jgi:hypothetical protein
MEQKSDTMRDRLLARLPQPENFTAYRDELAAGLERKEKQLLRVKWAARALWIYVIAFTLFCFYRGEEWLVTPNGHKFEFASLVLFICGALQLMKYFNFRSRVEILREVKQVQLQVLELQASLRRNEGK